MAENVLHSMLVSIMICWWHDQAQDEIIWGTSQDESVWDTSQNFALGVTWKVHAHEAETNL